jgi:GMP synthase (glutamine-hydrolysing)
MEDLDVSAFIEQQAQEIRLNLGEQKAVVAVSGGVDSTVTAMIAHKAIGDNLICVFIDDNFMRLSESEHVKNLLTGDPLNLPLIVLNERLRFMEALEGISNAEEKRKTFRETFYQALRETAEKEGCRYLIQGTIKADVEETTDGIKTQYNLLEQKGMNPEEKYGFFIIEPLKTLYKYQVREVARKMMIPPELTERQPFPSPGLSIRVVGKLTNEKLEELKKATFIVEEQLNPHSPSQFFAAIFSGEDPKELKALRRDASELIGYSENNVRAGVLNEKTTGIINGKRAYGTILTLALVDESDRTIDPDYDQLVTIRNYVFDNYPEATRLILLVDKRDKPGYIVTIRAVKTKDFLTASIMRLPWTTLLEAASKIFDSCPNVSRVYYDLTPKPPATIEYE